MQDARRIWSLPPREAACCWHSCSWELLLSLHLRMTAFVRRLSGVTYPAVLRWRALGRIGYHEGDGASGRAQGGAAASAVIDVTSRIVPQTGANYIRHGFGERSHTARAGFEEPSRRHLASMCNKQLWLSYGLRGCWKCGSVVQPRIGGTCGLKVR